MIFWMDISRDDDGELLSVVAGCDLCGPRTVTNDITEAKDWIVAHGKNYHENSVSKRIEQVGEPLKVNKKNYKPIMAPKARPTTAQDEVQALLETSGPMDTDAVREAIGSDNFNSTYKTLDRLLKAGRIRKHKEGRKVLWLAQNAPSEPLEQEVPTMTPTEPQKPVERLVAPFYGAPPLLQKFGDHAEVYSRFGFKGHMGNDYGIIMQPVLAAHDGTVEFSGDGGEWPIMGAAAGTCILLDGDTLRTGYAHLHHSYVAVGTEVKAGDVIGISGDTGATTGYHLHFEVLPKPTDHKNGYAGRVDPTPYLPTPTPVEAPHE